MLKLGRILSAGFTLIEIMIAIAVVGVMLALGLPAFFETLQNAQIRAAGENTLAGIQLARVEALKRNANVSFQLMTDLTSACAQSATAGNWVVSVDDAAGLCDVTDPAVTPFLIQAKNLSDGAANVTYDANGVAVITFNSLGQLTTAATTIDIRNLSSGGTCVADGGERRCLTIMVTAAGEVRMCDPAVTDVDDSRFC